MEVTNDVDREDYGLSCIKKERKDYEEDLHMDDEENGMTEDQVELKVEIKGIVKEEVEEDTGFCQVTGGSPPPLRSTEKTNKKGLSKVCGVCGKAAKSTHFGAVCCDACKAFFRRGVQSSVWETFLCYKNSQCDLRDNRRSCQYCRFKKCQSIGMDMSLVMTEKERKDLMSRKLERKRQLALKHKRLGGATSARQNHSCKQHLLLDPGRNVSKNRCELFSNKLSSYKSERPITAEEISDDCQIIEFLSSEDKRNIIILQKLLVKCLSFPKFPTHYYEENAEVIEPLFFIFCKSMGNFFSSIPEFQQLDPKDQKLLLKPAVAKAAFIFGTHQYEPLRNCWPRRLLTPSCNFPTITMPAMTKFVDDSYTIDKWNNFIEKYHSLYSDEIVTLLVLVVALFHQTDFYPEQNANLINTKIRYIQILEGYFQQHHSKVSISDTIPLIWQSLADVEELRHCFQNSTAKVRGDNIQNNKNSCRFSSSFDDTGKLPPKKALHLRNKLSSKAKEGQDIPHKTKYIGQMDVQNYSVQSECDETASESQMLNTPQICISPVLDHNNQFSKQTNSNSLVLQNTCTDMPGVIKTNQLIISPLPPDKSCQSKKVKDSSNIMKETSTYSDLQLYSNKILNIGGTAKSLIKETCLDASHTSQGHAALPYPDESLTPAQLEVLYRLGIQSSNFTPWSSSLSSCNSLIKHQAQRKNQSYHQKPIGQYYCKNIPNIQKNNVESLSSEELELLKAMQNMLPDHLAKHLARKIGIASPEQLQDTSIIYNT